MLALANLSPTLLPPPWFPLCCCLDISLARLSTSGVVASAFFTFSCHRRSAEGEGGAAPTPTPAFLSFLDTPPAERSLLEGWRG